MNGHSLRHVVVSLVLLLCGLSTASAQKDRVVRFHVAGFKGPGYSINIDGSVVKYRSGPSYKEPRLAWRRLRVDEKDLQRFVDRLAELAVFDWRPEYVCPAFDGVWWSLDVSWHGRKVSAHGSNKFPPHFDDLQDSIAELTHRPFGIPSKDRQECRDESRTNHSTRRAEAARA